MGLRTPCGRRKVLSPTGWQLFAFLLSHPQRTLDREEPARGAWGDGYGAAQRRAEIDLYICRLRRKLERDSRRPALIETVRNSGYCLTVVPSPLNET